LLEFTALKFGLDHFSDTIWGLPVEIETDCQALKDVLANDTISVAHARWRDGIIAHNIVAVRHQNQGSLSIADGLSQQWDNMEHTGDNGSAWTVSPEPEAQSGLINDLFTIAKLSQDDQQLRAHF
ncbi:hypothetical protein SCLCIDRAFT_118134, partial [Scleroderma citrinum Foug A]